MIPAAHRITAQNNSPEERIEHNRVIQRRRKKKATLFRNEIPVQVQCLVRWLVQLRGKKSDFSASSFWRDGKSDSIV